MCGCAAAAVVCCCYVWVCLCCCCSPAPLQVEGLSALLESRPVVRLPVSPPISRLSSCLSVHPSVLGLFVCPLLCCCCYSAAATLLLLLCYSYYLDGFSHVALLLHSLPLLLHSLPLPPHSLPLPPHSLPLPVYHYRTQRLLQVPHKHTIEQVQLLDERFKATEDRADHSVLLTCCVSQCCSLAVCLSAAYLLCVSQCCSLAVCCQVQQQQQQADEQVEYPCCGVVSMCGVQLLSLKHTLQEKSDAAAVTVEAQHDELVK